MIGSTFAGAEPMDSTIMQDATTVTDVSESLQPSQQSTHDALICGVTQSNQSPNALLQYGNVAGAGSSGMQYQTKMYGAQNMQQMSSPTMNTVSMNQAQMQAQAMLNQSTAAGNYINESQLSPTQATTSDLMGNLGGAKKRSVKAIRSHQIGRREPHNYDKSTPTPHQTNIYNQILAQQNRNQMQLQQQQQQLIGTPYNNSTNVYLAPQNVQGQVHTSPIQTTTNNYMNALNLSNSSNFALQGNQMPSNMMAMLSPNANQTNSPQIQAAMSPQQQQQHALKQNSSLLTLLSMKSEDLSATDSYKATSVAHQAAYKPYPTQQSLKNTGGYGQLSPRSHRLSSPPSHQMNALLTERQHATVSDKEMYRSKSLPLNSTLQMPVVKEETFAVPKYQVTKSTAARYRVRSNSMVLKHHVQHAHASSSLQNAASEPMLKSLAQLLTSSVGSGAGTSSGQQSSLANSLVSQANIVTNQQQRSYMLQQQSSGSSSSLVSPTIARSTNSFMPNSTPSMSPESLAGQDSPKYSRSSGSGSSGISANLSSSAGTSGDSMQRRVGHIHAEQKRRYNIKNGFDMLHSLIPQLQQNPNAKLSKAAMLQKGAEYIRQLRLDRDSVKQKMDTLRKERDLLNNSLK